MKTITSFAKQVSALYGGARAVVLTLTFIGAAFAWATTRASTRDVEQVRTEQRMMFEKLDRWAVRHFGDSFLDEPSTETARRP